MPLLHWENAPPTAFCSRSEVTSPEVSGRETHPPPEHLITRRKHRDVDSSKCPSHRRLRPKSDAAPRDSSLQLS